MHWCQKIIGSKQNFYLNFDFKKVNIIKTQLNNENLMNTSLETR